MTGEFGTEQRELMTQEELMALGEVRTQGELMTLREVHDAEGSP